MAGAAVFAAGQLTGRLAGRRRPRDRRRVDPQPVCGCEHHIAFHEDGVHRCHAKTGPARDRECMCQRYVGPQPLPTYVAGELHS